MGLFSSYFNAGDLDRLMELYAPDAVFMPEEGVVLEGLPAIRAALAEMLGLAPTMETTVTRVLRSGDTALVQVRWSLRGTAPDGSPVEQGGLSADVLRREPDGRYRVIIDRP